MLRKISTLLVISFVLVSCETKTAHEAEFYTESVYGDFSPQEYTEWMPKTDLQMFIDTFDSSSNWIYRAEGRDFKGLQQYRYALRKKPSKGGRYYVRSGRLHDEFYKLGVDYQRKGFKRVSLQLFKDGSGNMIYNGVWFKLNE